MSDGINALCGALRAVGVDHVFGVPGTQNVELFEGFRRHRLRTVLASHELAASFMANGFYRATGRVAALATIPGPGFTYALTGLAEARLDSVGLIYLVGKPATGPGRAFQLQAIDQATIAGPMLKGCLEIDHATDAARVIREAHSLATSGEPGPVMVHLDLRALSKTSAQDVDTDPAAPAIHTRLDELADAFGKARRPVFYLGGGALGSAERLERLAIRSSVPVLTTPTARGIVPEDQAVAMGFDPLRGNLDAANALLDRADLIVALGCKLGHNGSAGFQLRFAPEKLIHVDAEPAVLGANYQTRRAIVASADDATAALELRETNTDWGSDELASFRSAIRRIDAQNEPILKGQRALTPAEFFASLRQLLPRDTIVITDSGQHQILTRRHLDILCPRGLIVPSDFQSMGFGLPAAIGARTAVDRRPVIAIIGDGGFQMSGLELLTAKRESAGLVVFVFNDGYLSQIRNQQHREHGHTHAVELLNPNFETLAESFGIGYLRFDQAEPQQIQDALTSPAVTLVEVLVSDSMAMRAVPVVARAKNAARAVLGFRVSDWLRSGRGR